MTAFEKFIQNAPKLIGFNNNTYKCIENRFGIKEYIVLNKKNIASYSLSNKKEHKQVKNNFDFVMKGIKKGTIIIKKQ